MKFLQVFMSFVLVFNTSFYQAFAQTLQFEREPVTAILHTVLNEKVQDKGFSLDPDGSDISGIPFEREVAVAQGGPGSIYISENARRRQEFQEQFEREWLTEQLGSRQGTLEKFERGASHLIMGGLVLFVGTAIQVAIMMFVKQPMSRVARIFWWTGYGVSSVGSGQMLYGGFQMYTNSYFNYIFPGEFDYTMVMEDQSLELGYCSWLVTQSGYYEVTGCPNHPEILTPNRESQVLEITEPYRGVPFVVTSGTLL